jgi:hypothetical protein
MAQHALLEEIYSETRYPYTGTRFIIMSQTGLPLKKIKEWFENKNSNLVKRVGQKVLPGYGKNTKYVKAMTEEYEKDPKGYVEKLMAGTINLQTGEEQIPSPGPYGTQPKGHPHPVLLRKTVFPNGGVQIDLASESKMRRSSAPIQVDANTMMLHGLIPNDSFYREGDIRKAYEDRRLLSQRSASPPQDRQADFTVPEEDDINQHQFRKYHRQAHKMVGQPAMYRNGPINPMNGNLPLRESYASSSMHNSMAHRFHQSTLRDGTRDFHNIKKEDMLEERVGNHYRRETQGRPEYLISYENSFAPPIPGAFMLIPQDHIQSMRRFVGDIVPGNSKYFHPRIDGVMINDGVEYEIFPPNAGPSRHQFSTMVASANALRCVYSLLFLDPIHFDDSAAGKCLAEATPGSQAHR